MPIPVRAQHRLLLVAGLAVVAAWVSAGLLAGPERELHARYARWLAGPSETQAALLVAIDEAALREPGLRARLEPAIAGSLRFGGLELVGAPTEAWRPLRRAVQLCWQDPLSALNPYLSVAELIDEPRVIHGLPRWRVGSPELHASLARVALEPSIERRRPGSLSGGQRQRVAVARALAAEPSLLLADEVTSALDRPVAWALIDLLRGLRGDGLGLLLVTHDLSLLPGTIDQVVVLGGGEVVERGPARELLATPQHPVSRALRAAVPRLPYS